jgi:hypothetical protein
MNFSKPKMPWKYPALWFAVLMSIAARNSDGLADFMNPAYALTYLAVSAAIAYGLGYLTWLGFRKN